MAKKKNDNPFLTEEMLNKAIEEVGGGYKSRPNTIFMSPSEAQASELFKGAFIGSSIVEGGKRKILTPMDHATLGSVHHFVNMVAVESGTNAVSIPKLEKSSGGDILEESFSSSDFKMSDYKVHGTSESYSDMMLYKVLSASTDYLPTIVSPETSVLEKIVLALEGLRSSGQELDKSALMVDTDIYNDLIISTGGGSEAAKYWGRKPTEQYPVGKKAHLGKGVAVSRNTFLGVPIIEIPTTGTGDIYVINPQVATVLVAQDKEIGRTMRMGGGLMSDAIVISSDANAHIVSKHFDESTNDWCVDCWTCGYSHWAYEEHEADELLEKHADEGTRLFYKRNKI